MILFDSVSKVFPGNIKVADDVSFEIQEGETLVLLGTSGCGKTTILKMINRLYEPTNGQILIDGIEVMKQNPIELRRKIGYVIQHIGLFPHMTITENIAVVPKLLKWPQEKIDERVDELLHLVSLDPSKFRNRYPGQLSGGQKQRVGVARALAADPPIILMDEPFGALDPITREQLQNEFLDLESELKKTIVFVTHDVFEAAKMGDRIVLLDNGKIQHMSTPTELVEKPANDFVKHFLGQHRFQLSLLTKNVKRIIPKIINIDAGSINKYPKEDRLPSSTTLIKALDKFKETDKDTLPVFERGNFIGYLKKDQLLTEVTDLFDSKGGSV